MSSETSRDVLECEVDGYLIRARRTDAWDAIVALLVALDSEHPDYFHAVMQRCRLLSNSTPEIDGLDNLLTAPDQHLYDVGIERERRRSRQGYASPADARAFLQMARTPRRGVNPIAAAYFCATEAGDDVGTQMAFAMHRDETTYFERSRELAFLANVLVAGCSVQSRSFTPQEAADAAACICNLGLERWLGAPVARIDCDAGVANYDALLGDHSLVEAFEVGWSVLHTDVSLFVADRLISVLANVHSVDVDVRHDLRTLRRALEKQREAGTPWLARNAADVLAILDTTAWISVLGLLDECPIVPAALTAVLEGRSTPGSPTAFTFISTAAEIGDVRVFMAMLPALLAP
jgi:hypothetical protein